MKEDNPITNNENNSFPTFWMVFLEGRSTPVKKHSSYVLAVAEARRLAIKESRSAYVLETICAYVVQEPVFLLPERLP